MREEDPGQRVMIAVLVPFLVAIAALSLVAAGGFAILSATRAYVAGESAWSKGRSLGVAELRAYVATGDPAHFERFEAALAVPLGDRRARLELDRPDPRDEVVRAGFLDGRNAPEDIGGMIRLYRWFGGLSFMQEAIAAWARGDALIAELQRVGMDERARVARGGAPDPTLPARIDGIDAELLEAERHFTATLSAASRATERLLVGSTLGLAGLLAAGIVWYVRRTLSAQLESRALLAEANRRWQLAADAAGIGVFEWHGDEDRFVLDARGRALYGFDDGPVLARADLRARIHADDRPRVQAAWDDALQERRPLRQRFRIERQGAGVRHVEAIGLVTPGPRGEHSRIVGILRDITDELERARLGAEKQAAERVAQARMTFLSRLSHELRTPLNAVLGLAQLLRIDAGEPLTPGQARRVEMMERSGLQLLRLVEDVLDITRIDSGVVALAMQTTDVRAELHASLAIVEPERAAFGTVVDERLAPGLRVRADPQRLRQVFVNLLSNGCKYNRPGGRLTVEGVRESETVTIGFADEGAGLTAAQVGELFQPFKRLNPPPGVAGTGLGLVVVKLLVEQMGGTVSVDSAPGRGTRFTVRLAAA